VSRQLQGVGTFYLSAGIRVAKPRVPHSQGDMYKIALHWSCASRCYLIPVFVSPTACNWDIILALWKLQHPATELSSAGRYTQHGCILKLWLMSKGFAIRPSSSMTGMPQETCEQCPVRNQAQAKMHACQQAVELVSVLKHQQGDWIVAAAIT
jgi:hypothetical protein